jgi:predicted transposase/invertase (TIGR01784 family)
MDRTIAETRRVVDFVSQNEAMVHAYLLEQMTIMDNASWLREAREEGREEGGEEGREEQGIAVAKNALKEGLSVEVIKNITGLDIELIKKLSF